MDQAWVTSGTERVAIPKPLLDDDDPALFPKLTEAPGRDQPSWRVGSQRRSLGVDQDGRPPLTKVA